MKVLVIDNYDSFVYKHVQYIGELGAETVVYRNDQITLLEAAKIKPDRIVISPGPGNPEDCFLVVFYSAGISVHEFFGVNDFAAVCVDDSLMPKTNTQGWYSRAQRL